MTEIKAKVIRAISNDEVLIDRKIRGCKIEMKKDIPIIKVHHGKCDVCYRDNVLVVHYNYHQQNSRLDKNKGFRLCKRCYNKGQIVDMVEDNLMELEKAEVY